MKADSKKADHRQYRAVFNSWHVKIVDTLLKCLRSASRFEQRAGLNVLVKIIKLFPTIETGYGPMVERLGELAKKEGDGPPSDINTVALSLKAQLEKRKSQMLEEPGGSKAAPKAAPKK